MAEVVSIDEGNDAPVGGVCTNWTSLTSPAITQTYCTADTVSPGTTNPMRVPTTGMYHSYWKNNSMSVTGTGWNSIRDISIYFDGNIADDWGLDNTSGGGLYIGNRDLGDSTDNGHGVPLTSYAQATGTVGVSGNAIDDPTNGYLYYRSQTTPVIDCDTCLASAPHLIDATVYVAPFRSKIWVTQVYIPTTAAHGTFVSKSATVTYQVY